MAPFHKVSFLYFKKVMLMMNKKMKNEKRKSLPIRLNILFLLAFIIFTIVVVRLGMVQIVFGEDYTNEVQKQEEVDVSTSVPRGKIYNRI